MAVTAALLGQALALVACKAGELAGNGQGNEVVAE